MLTKLSIQNYALINQLEINFSSGLSIITGETGAGKSILLGALGLVLGNRADSSTLKNSAKKCIVEAELAIDNYQLKDVFAEQDLDYEALTVIRREILPSGKSRTFVNDTPVNLAVVNKLKSQLINIHSQHQTLQLSDPQFQFSIIDALAKNQAKIASYKRGLVQYNTLQKELLVLQENQEKENQQYSYNLHLFEELEAANLQIEEQVELEEKLDRLNNAEEIKLNLSEAFEKATNEEIGGQQLIHSIASNLDKITSFSKKYQDLFNRITSVKIELDDIITELENENDNIEFNSNELELINNRLQLIYNLQKKHTVTSIEELQEIKNGLAEKVHQVENAETIITEKQQAVNAVAKKLDALAVTISNARSSVLPKLTKKLENLLVTLGMPNARFSIQIIPTENYFSNGKDRVSFLFSANKGGHFAELKKVASGGELSRVMLAVKKILSENTQLPTIIFDEIDTGVSGEIANKMANIMQEMSRQMQVITITHLPQIAAKGTQHYKVYKEEVKGVTTTNLKPLSKEDRIVEIAEMLSGKEISNSALIHAKELLH